MSPRSSLALRCLAVVLLTATPVEAAKDRSLLVPEEFAPPTPAELALTSVSGAPGAPAVVLLEAAQIEYTLTQKQQVRHVRRVKILDDSGVARFGTFTWDAPASAKLGKIAARTVGSDGTVTDVGDGLHVDKGSGKGGGLVRVLFPRVAPGSILELRIEYVRDALYLEPWLLEQEIPVLESRLVVVPLASFVLSSVVLAPDGHLDAAASEKASSAAQAWSFRDLPPVGDEPLSPPAASLARKLCVDISALARFEGNVDITASWPAFADWQRREWYVFAAHSDAARDLAKTCCAGLSGVRERARAIHDTLAQRLRLIWKSAFLGSRSPKEVLASGVATSAELTGLALAMLRAQDIECAPTMLASRGTMTLAPRPLPEQLTDAIVAVRDPQGDFYFAPHLPFPVHAVPASISGACAFVIGKDEPVTLRLPLSAPSDNRTSWKADATLSATGQLTASLAVTYASDLAQDIRRDLSGRTDVEREARVREHFLAPLKAFRISSVSVEGLAGSGDVVVRAMVESSSPASQAGSRLVLTELPQPHVTMATWASPTRRQPIDLGQPMEISSEVTLHLAEGLHIDELPPDAAKASPSVGSWEVKVRQGEDGAITIQRRESVEKPWYGADSWSELRTLKRGLAEAESRPLVATVQPAHG